MLSLLFTPGNKRRKNMREIHDNSYASYIPFNFLTVIPQFVKVWKELICLWAAYFVLFHSFK